MHLYVAHPLALGFTDKKNIAELYENLIAVIHA